MARHSLTAVLLAALAGCTPDYSPNTYASNAVQQANKVEPGIVVGFRQVSISANGTVGAVTGGAAGGILGAQVEGSNVTTALGTVGGGLVGSLVGSAIEHVAGDTTGWEYIVRKPDGSLLSVTQKEPTAIPIGQKVLVITGNQARVVPDYSTGEPPPAAETGKDKDAVKDAAKPAPASEPASPPPAAAAPAEPHVDASPAAETDDAKRDAPATPAP